jgi:putative transposase
LQWASSQGVCIEHIQPSKPQQNAYAERFNRTFRYEWLSQYYWSDLDEVREFATQWMWRDNHERLYMALGGIITKQRLAMASIASLLGALDFGGLPPVSYPKPVDDFITLCNEAAFGAQLTNCHASFCTSHE